MIQRNVLPPSILVVTYKTTWHENMEDNNQQMFKWLPAIYTVLFIFIKSWKSGIKNME
jgi:hypothetical protein